MQRKLNWHSNLLTNGENISQGKNPQLGNFKTITLKNPLINNQAVTSIKNLTTILVYPEILTYSCTFAPIPNLTWSCSSLLSLDAHISNLWLTLCTNPCIWLTLATWIDVVSCKVLHFINNEDQEALGYKTLWRTSAVASHRENKSLGLWIRVWRLLK